MTRNYEIDCRDLFECDHHLEIALSEGGEIVEWRCRCGKRVERVATGTVPLTKETPK